MNTPMRVALVTGGSRGIGAAIAKDLASKKFFVVVHYSSNIEAAQKTLDAITTGGGKACLLQADFTTRDSIRTFAHDLQRSIHKHTGKTTLDVLVNNAGINNAQPFDSATEEELDTAFAVNVKAPFFLAQQLLPLIHDGGSIVNISSGTTRIAYPHAMSYNLTKSAINSFTLHLAALLGPQNIRVNAVLPGVVDTDMNAAWLHDADAQNYVKSMTALGRIGEPEDIAGVVSFLASDESRWITGQLIDATGGAHL